MSAVDRGEPVLGPTPEQYNDSPELARGCVAATFQMLHWVIFHQTAWVHYLSRSGLSLPTDFCLAQCDIGHLRRPEIRQLLLGHFLILPAFVAVLVAAVLLARGVSTELVWFGVALSVAIYLFVGLTIGGLNNAGAGGWGVFGGVLAGSLQEELALSQNIYDLVNLPANLRETLVVCAINSFLAGAVGALLIALATPKENRRLRVHARAIVWGIVAGVLLGGAAVLLLNSFPHGFNIVKSGGPLFSMAAFATVLLRTNSLRRSLLFGVAFFLLTFGLAALVLSQKDSHSYFAPAARGFATGMSFEVFSGMLFALPFALASRVAKPFTGAVAGALVSGGVHGYAVAQLHPSDQLQIMATCFVCAFLGLSISRWGTVFVWPFECLWNYVILRLDESTPAADPSRLPMNAAFWDEHQWLRLWGLATHLVRVYDRNSAELDAAIRYLEGGNQDWARAAALAELDARILKDCKDVDAIITVTDRLKSRGENIHIRRFINVSEKLRAAVSARNGQELRSIADELDGFIRNTRWYELFARRLERVANGWSRVVTDYLLNLQRSGDRPLDHDVIRPSPAPAPQPRGRTDMPAILTGPQIGSFAVALKKAFVQPDDLAQLLQHRLDKALLDYTAVSKNYRSIANDVVDYASSEGWWLDLLAAARSSRPRSDALLEFERSMGLGPIGLPDAPGLERYVTAAGLQDAAVWYQRLGAILGRVCRVEVRLAQGTAYGTGFLIGADMVLTNYHVVEAVLKGWPGSSAGTTTCRFDYAARADGSVAAGRVVKLDASKAIVSSPYSPLDKMLYPKPAEPGPDFLDYALLRLEEPVGAEPIGDKPEPTAPARGWLSPPQPPYDFATSELYIVQYPRGRPIKLALSTEALEVRPGDAVHYGRNATGTRVLYRTNTDQGSSGSACFGPAWELAALHHAGDPDYSLAHTAQYNQGIPIDAIVADLKDHHGIELAPTP